MKRGKLIVIEGGDACGKHTQSESLRQRLADLIAPSVPPMLLSFPRYNTPVGQAIVRHLKGKTMLAEDHQRAPEDALVFQCMMVADKYHAAFEVEEHLKKGGHVVCDRWWQSAYIYGGSDGLDSRWLSEVHRLMPEADLNLLLDVPADEASSRRPVFRDRYEESMTKRKEIRKLYSAMWEAQMASSFKWVVIDGTNTVEVVHESIWRRVGRLVEEDVE
jgi:dTMP kinase